MTLTNMQFDSKFQALSRCAWQLRIAQLVAVALLVGVPDAIALEHVAFRQSSDQAITGRILVEAQDGGLVIEGRNGAIVTVQPDELKHRKTDATEFSYQSSDEIGSQLLNELPDGFDVFQTNHYVICYNTSRAYAQWTGSLFERLHRAFYNYWRQRGFELHDSPPLVALVFQDKVSYDQYARKELGDATNQIIGYYSLNTNRITTYDLTGQEGVRRSGDRRATIGSISQILRRPAAERIVATVIHEATHQLAFNSGLQNRLADIPVWLSEGLAIYFETPDLRSSKGWRGIGRVNQVRLAQMQKYLRRRDEDSLASLLTSDARFRSGDTESAYAEAWALCYFLIRTRPKQFVQYLSTLEQKRPMISDDADARMQDFKAAFGSNLERLDTEFVRSTLRLR